MPSRPPAIIRVLGHILQGDIARLKQIAHFLWQKLKARLPKSFKNIVAYIGFNPVANQAALIDLIKHRQDPAVILDPTPLPIDISIVTYNSSQWIEAFTQSLCCLEYPKNLINLTFVDNNSTDNTVSKLSLAVLALKQQGFRASIHQRPNYGFGRGHNYGIAQGTAAFCLVSNIDLVFEPDTLTQLISHAQHDNQAAAWECRQKPYEHPKFYDPISLATNWNSHACILLRRSAFNAVGGYDHNLFMYCEDVELSYRLRRAGYLLRYCPKAVVYHYTYEQTDITKPLQLTGSTLGNLYLRVKYGTVRDILAIPAMLLYCLLRTGTKKSCRNFLKLVIPAWRARLPGTAHYPFRGWDYELTRIGCFYPIEKLETTPLVSIITRTYPGRGDFLAQAIRVVQQQTYPNIEHIIVEDGGNTLSAIIPKSCVYIPADKVGRSNTGNLGLAAAGGKYCCIYDDDDLLFADHIEVLVAALKTSERTAAYSLSWEISTESDFKLHPQYQQAFNREKLSRYNYMTIQSVLFTRDCYLQYGGFDPELDALEDWELWNRYAQDKDFIFVNKLTSIYRVPACRIKANQRAEQFKQAYPSTLAKIKNNAH